MKKITVILLISLMVSPSLKADFLSSNSNPALNETIEWLQFKCASFKNEQTTNSCLLAIEESLNGGQNATLPIIQFIKDEPKELQIEVKKDIESYWGVVKSDYSHIDSKDYPTFNN